MNSTIQYIKTVLLSTTLFGVGLLFNVIAKELSDNDIGPFLETIAFIAALIPIYALYLFFTATSKRLSENGIPGWYSMLPMILFIVYGLTSVLGMFFEFMVEPIEKSGTVLLPLCLVLVVLLIFFATLIPTLMRDKN